MPISYILLSPTFGMHQYTADLVGRIANCELRISDGQPIARLVTTATYPRDRYAAAIQVHTPITAHGTGFSREGLDIAAYRRAQASILSLQSSLYHFTGVHAWNVPLVYALRRRGVPVIHTLHDLDPHTGVRFGPLIRLWNRLIIASGCHLLVHGRRYRDQLLAAGIPAERVTCTPLLHGFLSADRPWPPEIPDSGLRSFGHSTVTVIFFGRIEAYKGVETLLAAWPALSVPDAQAVSAHQRSGKSGESASETVPQLIIAGPVARDVTLPPLPPEVELRDRRIPDAEADALFRSASLLVLPYRDATQSALIAAAYAYGVPVIVTATGALPEYVADGETGWIVPPADPVSLAAALRAALAAPARLARMGAAGRAWFNTHRAEETAALWDLYVRAAAHGHALREGWLTPSWGG